MRSEEMYQAGANIHSPAWLAQAWANMLLSLVLTAGGIFYLPVDQWIKGFLAMGLSFSLASAISLTKTLRDLHEGKKLASRIDDAKLQKILVEHDPFTK
ncbi:YiaA/YiaB family inner membrane protein [Gloeobacter kilaueensis]|uniref:YiaAB two helix domain-containing protein n=1 Tax=Gloeobacter kilaueensis (strain ATCC BAA-2537 / CCAP 1431/1 / ULC 316 / JS1) TaxID=1183438 RepID=U5QK34_GLOK1|nr:YiaA/YiaB family inner membrane protein [Gloeobacter kilaueensis]AGY59307.1 hypothetical protein GKIL_3061 [Gloeobacter kilaueensis JS1]